MTVAGYIRIMGLGSGNQHGISMSSLDWEPKAEGRDLIYQLEALMKTEELFLAKNRFFFLGVIISALTWKGFSREQSGLFVSPSALGRYNHAAIASDAPGCATQGRRIMERNGSVIDAMITTSLCNGLVNVHSMGIGGGFFMVYYRGTDGKTFALDARETAPEAATEDIYNGKLGRFGPLSIAVPSELKGLYAAWKRFGRLPWADLFADSIAMCRNGVVVTPTLHLVLSAYGPMLPVGSPIWKLFYNETTQRIKGVGDLVYRPKLADYLECVAANPEGLQTGELHKDVAADLSDMNSLVTYQDLLDYVPIWKKPLEMPLRVHSKGDNADYILHSMPLPSASVLVGLALNTLSGFNYSRPENMTNSDGALFYHRLIEVYKHMFAQRSYLTDSDWMTRENLQKLQEMKTYQAAEYLVSKIHDNTTYGLEYYEPAFLDANDVGTSHLSIVGPEGDAVSFTSTINTIFGSGMIGERTGILFNDEMNDFSTPSTRKDLILPPAPHNNIQPRKRPLSSMSPLVITHASNNSLRLVVGGSGGSQILTSVIQSTFANLNLGMSIKESIDASRVHHQLAPNVFRYEKNLPEEILTALQQIGHKSVEKPPSAAVQGIEIVNGPCNGRPLEESGRQCLLANADYRKGGTPDGF